MTSPIEMQNAELQRMLDWANQKIEAGEEPPWAWYQYMKLRETLEAILEGRRVVKLVAEDDDKPVMPI